MQIMRWMALGIGMTLAAAASAATPATPATPAAAAPVPRELLDPLFRDHAVLQRDRPIDLWGWAAPGETVIASIVAASAEVAGTASATADSGGRWIATLPRMAAGGPYDILVRASGGATQQARDVLAGDVWLCSGQSNMVLQVNRTLNSRTEIENANNDSIRMLTVGLDSSPIPLDHFTAPARWEPTTPATVPEFSAACYYFARELQATVRVPMGLVNASWGGSNIQTWMSRGAIHATGAYEPRLNALDKYATDTAAGTQMWGGLWEAWWRDRIAATHAAGMTSDPWRPGESPASDWRVAPAKLGYWETWGVPELANFDGMVWFRTQVKLTARQAAQPATLRLGPVDEVDHTWLNGRFVGTTSGPDKDRVYELPRGLLKAGDNTIVVNALDTYGYGGMYGPAQKRELRFADGTAAPLDGEWRYQIVPASIGPALRSPWEPVAGVTVLYNAMIAPLFRFGFRGVLWYQGESNTSDPGPYRSLLTGLMADWRRQFGPDLAFFVVQLANYGPVATVPTDSGWAAIRDAERLAVASDARAGLAVAVDIGDRYDIHPANKQEVGRRLARAARHVVYGEPIGPSGPAPVAAHREGRNVVVTFKDIEGSLVAYSAARPFGFELCGVGVDEPRQTCRFVDATLQPDRVVLEPADGVTPARVRFCWADSPVCNLYDRSGLPAGPFELAID